MNSKVKHILFLLSKVSKNNYIVGGAVRDGFLGLPVKDYDIVTDVHMDISKPLLKEAGFLVKEVGEQFLVLNVAKDGEMFDLANFRKDGITLDGRKPTSVEIGTIEEDAFRRDFTINAIYEGVNGQILDPTGQGLSDIKNRILRFVGNPKERIREDYLRLFRYYRFLTTKKQLSADPKSLKACRELFNEAYIKTNPERVRLELERMI